MCAKWNVQADGVADDAIFAKNGHASGSIADEFASSGVRFERARKADRLTGWNRMRKLLSWAGMPDRPGLYVARNCGYFWQTAPTLARDQKRIEDVDTTGPDHGADAIRYGCLRTQWAIYTGIGSARKSCSTLYSPARLHCSKSLTAKPVSQAVRVGDKHLHLSPTSAVAMYFPPIWALSKWQTLCTSTDFLRYQRSCRPARPGLARAMRIH